MMIRKVQLNNFRQFRSKTIEFKDKRTIIVAPNAAGKSTIIEALYMLSHGESPWELQNRNLVRKIPDKEKSQKTTPKNIARIEATIESEDELQTIALALISNGSSTTKKFQIEGAPTDRRTFVNSITCLLFSPDLIDILMYEPSQRRRFLDQHASRIFQDLLDITLRYKNVLRQRNSLLKILAHRSRRNGYQNNDTSIDYWTEQLVSLGSEILLMRHKFLNLLNTSPMSFPTILKYTSTVPIHELEDLGTGESIRKLFQKQLSETAKKERHVGATLVGPHRDDWNLQIEDQDISTFGSRGEKRMAITDIIFKLSHILQESTGNTPALLLDDITSELDSKNIERLFLEKINPDQQTIITTTNIDSLPATISDSSHIISL